eukprot:TRINITY_DN8501_c0_g1_i1.p1 TRINITY_DN8501_c0_g1~~TRINITY_DN8501_c0_g1_i1.p1  ORF type:complete len:875 (-),score=238.11 TRINITY_DN8501_c0_g1_i1:3-2264(-)
MNKQEEKNLHFGKVFGILAITKSNRLTELNDDIISEILESLVEISQKKPYFKELACEALTCILEMKPSLVVPKIQQLSNNEKTAYLSAWSINQLTSLIKKPNIPKDQPWVAEILQFMVIQGLFQTPNPKSIKNARSQWQTWSQINMSETTKKLCGSRFIGLLTDLNNLNLNKSDKSGQHVGQDADGEFWLYLAAQCFHEALKSGYVELDSVSDQMKTVRNSAWSKAFQIHKKADKDPKHKSFELLFLVIGFSFLQTEESAELLTTVEDLDHCYSELFSKSKKKGETEPINVLVDVMVSLLSQNGTMFRDVVQRVFRVFCRDLTQESLNILIEIVVGKPLEEASEEEDESDMEDEEDEIEMDESGLVADKDISEDEEEDMIPDDDDEEMEKYDLKLAEMFKHMKAQKSMKRELENKSLHFKFKILDLIDIAAKKLDDKMIIFTIILPLIRAVKSNRTVNQSEAILSKVVNILEKKIYKGGYPVDLSEEDVDVVHSVLKSLWGLTNRSSSKELSLVGHGILFLVRALIGNKKPGSPYGALHQQPFLEQFHKKMDIFFSKKKLNATFFMEMLVRHPWLAWNSLDNIFQGIQNGKTDFLKSQPFAFFASIVKQHKPEPEEWSQLIPRLKKAFETVISNPMQPKRIRDILGSINIILQQLNNAGLSRQVIQTLWPSSALQQAITTLTTNENYKTKSIDNAIQLLQRTINKEGNKRKTENQVKDKPTKKQKKGQDDKDTLNEKKPVKETKKKVQNKKQK